MERRRFLELLGEIERSLPVAEWRCADVRIWPLMRLELYASNNEVIYTSESLEGTWRDKLRATSRALTGWGHAFISDFARNTLPWTCADAVFLTYSAGTQPLVAGRRRNPLLAPYVQLLSRLSRTATVWEMSPYGVYNVPRFTPSCFIQPMLLGLRAYCLATTPKDLPLLLPRFGDYRSILQENGLDSRYASMAALRRDAYFIRRLADRFKAWMSRAAPRLGFVADYSPRELAFCLACRELGVVSVELQHGYMGELHPPYSSWFAVPPNGYELRPQVYWCWDAAGAAVIESWARQSAAGRAVVGGDPWRTMWSDDEDPQTREARREVSRLRQEAGGRLHVLVNLTTFGEPVPEPVLEAFARAPADWRFWFRLHPSNQYERIPLVETLLRERNLPHVDVRAATEAPLPAVLQEVDVHVAISHSSVIRDAADFGVPSVCLSPVASELYAPYVASGLLRVSGPVDDLVAAVKDQSSRRRQPSSDPRLDPLGCMRSLLAASVAASAA
jgi:hypothetical protein